MGDAAAANTEPNTGPVASNPEATPTPVDARSNWQKAVDAIDDMRRARAEPRADEESSSNGKTAEPANQTGERGDSTPKPNAPSLRSSAVLEAIRAAKPAEPPAEPKSEKVAPSPVPEEIAALRSGNPEKVLKALETFGLTQNQLADVLLNGEKATSLKPSGTEAMGAFEKKIASIEEGLRKIQEDQESRQQQQVVNQAAADIRGFVEASDGARWELLSQESGYDVAAVQFIQQQAAGGNEVSVEVALDALESALEDRYRAALDVAQKVKKLGLQPLVPANEGKEDAQGTPSRKITTAQDLRSGSTPTATVNVDVSSMTPAERRQYTIEMLEKMREAR